MNRLEELIRLVEIDKENYTKIEKYNDEIYKMFYKLADGFTYENVNLPIGRIKDGDENVFLAIDFQNGEIISFEINAIIAAIDILAKNIKRKYDKNHEKLIQLIELKERLK